ncbi:MAG: enoyl-CoA hydratase/isomerase family protein [Bacteroidales bacterium]|nr:enoyl-CoA hydratase/isomerase family protein [Bacteroidales bacterium]
MQNIEYSISENIGIARLNRPEIMNALCSALVEDLNTIIDDITQNKNINVLIITGNGDNFAVGADISEMVNVKESEALDYITRVQYVFNRLTQLPIPVIAALNGYTIGGGLELALACDIRIASEKTIFSMPETNLGIIPGGGGTQRLSRVIGIGNALNWFFTCDKFTAEEALNLGLIQKIVDDDYLLDETIIIAQNIAKKSPSAIAHVKEITRTGIEMDFYRACEMEAKGFAKSIVNDGREGMSAFLEKRKPIWNK